MDSTEKRPLPVGDWKAECLNLPTMGNHPVVISEPCMECGREIGGGETWYVHEFDPPERPLELHELLTEKPGKCEILCVDCWPKFQHD